MAVLKGAFLSFGAGVLGGLPNIIVFQFNPTQITRSPSLAQPPSLCTDGNATDASQQPCPPGESISFTLRIDATEQLAQGNPIAASSGILPTLSAIELLMTPKSALASNLASLASLVGGGGGGSSVFQFPPSRLPTVLFFWGPFRIVPIAITSLSITETEYNTMLTPIRADVAVSMQVLLPSQLLGDQLGIGAYNYTLGVKQAMAALNLANAAEIGVSAALSFSI
jgi:hypothetical protein